MSHNLPFFSFRDTASEPPETISTSPVHEPAINVGASPSPIATEATTSASAQDCQEGQEDSGMDNSPPADHQLEENMPSTEVTTLSEDNLQEEADSVQDEAEPVAEEAENVPEAKNVEEEVENELAEAEEEDICSEKFLRDRAADAGGRSPAQMDHIQPVLVIVTEPTPDPSTGSHSDLADHDDVSNENMHVTEDGEEDESLSEMVDLFILDKVGEENEDASIHRYRLSMEPGRDGWKTLATFRAFSQQVENSTEVFVSQLTGEAINAGNFR